MQQPACFLHTQPGQVFKRRNAGAVFKEHRQIALFQPYGVGDICNSEGSWVVCLHITDGAVHSAVIFRGLLSPQNDTKKGISAAKLSQGRSRVFVIPIQYQLFQPLPDFLIGSGIDEGII